MMQETSAVLPSPAAMYRALVARDASYEGVFWAAVTTTGVFCRPTCPARKPKLEHVRWFGSAQAAMLAGFRPCQRCRPLERSGATPAWAAALVDEVEANPSTRLSDGDLRDRGLEPARVRRWFLAAHRMTFHAYQRARRLRTAMQRLAAGDGVVQAGLDGGWESTSAFHDAVVALCGRTPSRARGTDVVHVTRVPTPLGPMLAAATEAALCLLEFDDRRMLETQLRRLLRWSDGVLVPGENAVLAQLRRELDEYFAGTRRTFDVPLWLPGTEFQTRVWAALREVPYGTTCSYGELAARLGCAPAVRAVARANGDNCIAILVPCHRVIGADGKLTGYGGGLWRKRRLLDLEHGQRALV